MPQNRKPKKLHATLTLLLSLCLLCACNGAITDATESDHATAVASVASLETVTSNSSAKASSHTKTATSSKKKTGASKTPVTATSTKAPVAVQDKTPVVENEKLQIVPAVPAVYTSVAKESYHYAAKLTGTFKAAYTALENAVATFSIGMIDLGDVSQQEARMIFMAVRNDHPEYFWIPSRYYTDDSVPGHFKIGMQVDRKSDPEQTVTYLCTDAERKAMSTRLSQALQAVTAHIQEKSTGGKLSDFELELALHDWICETTTYDHGAAKDPDSNPLAFTAYGALVQGKAVCEGYSRAAQLLLNTFGIKATLVVGTDHTGSDHMWNLVQINGEWYHLDLTWDDDDDTYYHYYFNLSDTLISRDHIIAPSASGSAIPNDFNNYMLPVCTAEAARYIVQAGTRIDSVDRLRQQMLDGLLAAIDALEPTQATLVCEFGFAAACTPPTPLLDTVDDCIDPAFQNALDDALRKRGRIYAGLSLACPGGENGGFAVTCKFKSRS